LLVVVAGCEENPVTRPGGVDGVLDTRVLALHSVIGADAQHVRSGRGSGVREGAEQGNACDRQEQQVSKAHSILRSNLWRRRRAPSLVAQGGFIVSGEKR